MEINLTSLGFILNAVMVLGSVAAVVYKLGRAVEKFEVIGHQQAREITELKQDVKIISDVLTKTALQTQRQDILEDRQNRFEQLLDDFRRGEGFILPISPRQP